MTTGTNTVPTEPKSTVRSKEISLKVGFFMLSLFGVSLLIGVGFYGLIEPSLNRMFLTTNSAPSGAALDADDPPRHSGVTVVIGGQRQMARTYLLSADEIKDFMPDSEQATILTYSWLPGKPALVIWSDAQDHSISESVRDAKQIGGNAELRFDKTVRLGFQSGKKGHEILGIRDQNYDLTLGRLFLISRKGGDLQVEQLDRDLTELLTVPGGPNKADGFCSEASLIEFGKSDPALKAFFAPRVEQD